MNEKLFKKLNEQIELVTVKNSLNISKEDENNLIFNGLSLNDLLLCEEWQPTKYSFVSDLQTAWKNYSKEETKAKQPQPAQKNKDKPEEKEVKKSERQLRKEAQEDYDEEYAILDRDATLLNDEIDEYISEFDNYLKPEYLTKPTDEMKENIKECKEDIKRKYSEVEDLLDDLKELNHGRPTGVKIKSDFSKLNANRRAVIRSKFRGIV